MLLKCCKVVTVLQPHRTNAMISISSVCVFFFQHRAPSTSYSISTDPINSLAAPFKQYEIATFAISNSIDDSLFTNLGQNFPVRNWILLSPCTLTWITWKKQNKTKKKKFKSLKLNACSSGPFIHWPVGVLLGMPALWPQGRVSYSLRWDFTFLKCTENTSFNCKEKTSANHSEIAKLPFVIIIWKIISHTQKIY